MDDARNHYVFLVPGFCEPNWLMIPLRESLKPHVTTVRIWPDRWMFRSLDRSVARLRDAIQEVAMTDRVSIVTHSFGDWITRQSLVIASGNNSTFPPIDALVSIAPIATASPMAEWIHCLGGRCISEIRVMAAAEQASLNNNVDASIRRLVLWASVDFWVRPIEIAKSDVTEVRQVTATHLSIVLQPNVWRSVREFVVNTPSRHEVTRIRSGIW